MIHLTTQERMVLIAFALVLLVGSVLHYAFKRLPGRSLFMDAVVEHFSGD